MLGNFKMPAVAMETAKTLNLTQRLTIIISFQTYYANSYLIFAY
jgi:hypothetical protein